jgi:hypothetical protein
VNLDKHRDFLSCRFLFKQFIKTGTQARPIDRFRIPLPKALSERTVKGGLKAMAHRKCNRIPGLDRSATATLIKLPFPQKPQGAGTAIGMRHTGTGRNPRHQFKHQPTCIA